jgi:predicted amidohydrolase YtcJ
MPRRAQLLIHDAQVGLDGRVDVTLRDGRVASIQPKTDRHPGQDGIDGRGGWLIPGLHDHHIHLAATAAALTSVICGPPEVSSVRDLRLALRRAAAAVPPGAWIRGIAYHESVAGELDRFAIDRWESQHPVRIQHRSGALWMLNSAAVQLLQLAPDRDPGVERTAVGVPTGRLWRADHLLQGRAPDVPDTTAIARRLLGLGVTGVTDATPDIDDTGLALLERAARAGLQVCSLGLSRPQPRSPVAVGPRKIIIDDPLQLNVTDLVREISRTHRMHRGVAIHCVSVDSLLLALTALEEVGVDRADRLEHVAWAGPAELRRMRDLGVRVVTQPSFIADRGDSYLQMASVGPEHDGWLYRYRSLLSRGIPVAPSSDAPYGEIDPWRVLRCARDRQASSGRTIGAQEQVEVPVTLAGYLSSALAPGGPVRRIAQGENAHMCLLHVPREEAIRSPDSGLVRLTVVRGQVVAGA